MSSELQRQFLLRAFRLSPIRQKAIARLYSNGRIDQHLQVLRRRLKDGKEQMARMPLRSAWATRCSSSSPRAGRRSGCVRCARSI